MKTIEVLLVDDNPADADLTREALASNFCRIQIHSVVDGICAMEYLRREGKYANARRPDFIILDLSLPKMDGRMVLAAIKADIVLRQIPITIFSTSQAPQDVQRSYDLGANCYVSKPGNLTGFMSVVKSIAEFWFDSARLPNEEEQ